MPSTEIEKLGVAKSLLSDLVFRKLFQQDAMSLAEKALISSSMTLIEEAIDQIERSR